MLASLTHLCKSYQPTPDAPRQTVLHDLSLDVPADTSLAIMGASGCGKSTLLHLLGTLDRPDSGTITLFGENVASLSDDALSRFRAQKIGFIFQLHHLLPHLTTLENVLVPTMAGGLTEPAAVYQERAHSLLAKAGLTSHIHKKPALLSGGERQRVAVCRALIRQPTLILADEPTGALDSRTATSLIDLLLELREATGATLVTVTHDQQVAARMTTQHRMADGRLVTL